MFDPFDRRISFIGVALVKGRLRNFGSTTKKVKEALRTFICEIDGFTGAPFLWVQLAFWYGIKNDLKVDFKRVGKQYGELPIAPELDMEILQWADQNNLDLIYDIFMIASLEALIQVAQKYKLPQELFLEERSKYGQIPATIEECISYPSKPKL